MGWTKNTPSVAGWYWYRGGKERVGVSVVEIDKHGSAWFSGVEIDFVPSELKGEWYGPLAPPD